MTLGNFSETALQQTPMNSRTMGGLPIQPVRLTWFLCRYWGTMARQRVGYGQGFTTDFSASVHHKLFLLGCLVFRLAQITDCEPTDIRLHSCVHSGGIVEF